MWWTQVSRRAVDKGMVWPKWKPREHPRLAAPLRRKRLRKRRRWAGPAGGWGGTSIFRAIRSGDVLLQVQPPPGPLPPG